MWLKGKKFNPNAAFLLCTAILIFYFYVILSKKWLPFHDVLGLAMVTHQFGSSLATHHEWAYWWPYLAWGQPSNFYTLALLPPSLIFLLPFFQIFPSLNAVTVLYASFFVSEFVLLVGTFLLSRLLFKRISTVFLVCLSTISATQWYGQAVFRFYIFYSLPLCIYFILKGTQKNSLNDILKAGLIFITCASYGMVLYVGIMPALYLFVFLSACIALFWNKKKPIEFSKSSFFLAGTLLFAIAIPAVYLFCEGTLSILAPGRQAQGGVNYLNFLNYGYDTSLEQMKGLLDGRLEAIESSFYGGAFIAPLIMVGLVFSRDKKILPFLFAMATIFLVYCGKASFLAPLLYYVPGFAFFRHLGLVGMLIKFSLAFLAGFGFEILLDGSKASKNVFLAGLLGFGIICAVRSARFSGPFFPALYYFGAATVVWLTWNQKRHLIIFLMLIAFVDCVAYRLTRLGQLVPVSNDAWALFQPRAAPFQPRRIENYFSEEKFSIFSNTFYPNPKMDSKKFDSCLDTKGCHAQPGSPWVSIYAMTEPFLQFDPCFSIYRNDTAVPNVAKLYKSFSLGEKNSRLPEPLKQLAGCTPYSKLQKSHTEFLVREFTPNRLRIQTNTTEAGPLIYADAYTRDWRATVNGVPAQLSEANGAFKTVSIPKGEATVEFIYAPTLSRIFLALIWIQTAIFIFYSVRMAIKISGDKRDQPA